MLLAQASQSEREVSSDWARTNLSTTNSLLAHAWLMANIALLGETDGGKEGRRWCVFVIAAQGPRLFWLAWQMWSQNRRRYFGRGQRAAWSIWYHLPSPLHYSHRCFPFVQFVDARERGVKWELTQVCHPRLLHSCSSQLDYLSFGPRNSTPAYK